MSELSPAAQAVRSAYHEICEDYIETWLSFNHNRGLAAALRTVADQVVPEEQRPPRRGVRPGGTDALTPEEGAEDQRAATRRHLLTIAAELEAQ